MARIEFESPEGLLAELNSPRGRALPAISHGVFAESRIDQLRSGPAVVEAFHDVAVNLTVDYNAYLGPPGELESGRTSLGKLIRMALAHDELPYYVSECDTPAAVAEAMPAPPLRSGQERPISHLFVSGKKTFTPFHYDGDLRDVLLHQVFGQKRIYLFDPRASQFLAPLFNFSSIDFGAWSVAEREQFVDRMGGFWGELNPGDSVYFPAGWWHAVEYVTPAMSVNFRFGRDLGSFLLALLPCNFRVPLAFRELSKQARVTWAAELLQDYFRFHPSPESRFLATRQNYDTKLRDLGLASFGLPLVQHLDLELRAIRRDFAVQIARVPNFDYEVDSEHNPIRSEAPATDRQMMLVDTVRERVGPERWSAWLRLLHLPDHSDQWVNYQAALLERLGQAEELVEHDPVSCGNPIE